MNNFYKPLDKRLGAISSHLKVCNVTADVGCDHGLLSLFVLKNNISKNVVCIDISEKCLQKTKNLLKKAGVDKLATFIQCDGLKDVKNTNINQVVVAGMGGINISQILENMAPSLKKASFILQPMNNITVLRKTLNKLGMKINRDEIIFDKKKYYHIICASEGNQKLTLQQIRCGAVTEDYRTEEYQKWLKQKIEKVEKIVAGVSPTNEKYAELIDYLNSLKKCVF